MKVETRHLVQQTWGEDRRLVDTGMNDTSRILDLSKIRRVVSRPGYRLTSPEEGKETVLVFLLANFYDCLDHRQVE